MKTGNIGIRNLAAIGIADIDVYGTSNRRILTIKYLSSTVDEKNINLTFVVTQNNLTKLNATIFVQETNADNETAVNKIIKLQNIRDQKVTVSFDKNKKFDRYLWQSGLLFQATITCDGLAAETVEFKLKFEKRIETKIEECLCKKTTLSADDLRFIVTKLRKLEGTGTFQILRDTSNTKNFSLGEPIKDAYGKVISKELSQFDSIANDKELIKDRLFYLNRDENITKIEREYSNLAKWINYIFEKTEAKKCINKIHLFCQIYHETERFGSSYESDTNAGKSGEDFYRGRGLLMVTKKGNYENLFEYLFKKEPNVIELEEFVPRVADTLELAAKSAVWYINSSKIKDYFNEEDSVDNVTASINYPKALITKNYDPIYGMKERRLFFNLLKQILNYEDCKN